MNDHRQFDHSGRPAGLSRRGFLALAGLGAGASLLAACQAAPPAAPTAAASKPADAAKPAEAAKPAAPAAPAAAPAAVSKPANQGGTLVVAADAVGDNYVPAVVFQGYGTTWTRTNVYENLYTFRDFKTLIPALATGHTVSDDGLVYTFQLRKGVKFHDGTPFNAEAVEFNYMRYLDKEHPFYEPNAVFRGSILPNVKSVKAKDDFTVEIVREKPSAAFIANLSSQQAGLMSPTAVKKHGVQDAGRYPIGTGPFVFEKAEKGNQSVVRAFDEYWGGRPPLDRVVIRVMSEEQAVAAGLRSGEVDLTPFIDFKDLAAYRNNPNLNVLVVPAPSSWYTAMNQGQAPMQDVRVRRAVAHALNNQKAIDTVYYGEGETGAGLTAPPLWGYAPHLKDYYKYDPDKAKSLLNEAGGPASVVIHTQSSGLWPRWAEVMQADLNAVGFKATIEKIDSTKFFAQMTEGKHQLFLSEADYNNPDPEDIYNTLHGCENPRRARYSWCDPAMDQLMIKQGGEKDQDKRKQILWDIQKIILDSAVQIPNFYYNYAMVTNKRVEGFVLVSKLATFFNTTYLTKK